MSLLLSAMGAAALLTTSAAAPVATGVSSKMETYAVSDANMGRLALGKQISASSKALGAPTTVWKEDVQHLKFSIAWEDLGVDLNDYFNINWEESSFTIISTVSFSNNVWAVQEKPVSDTWFESFRDVEVNPLMGKMFKASVTNDWNSNISEFGRETTHGWSYTVRDSGFGLDFDATVSASARNKFAYSYASISFDSIIWNFKS